MSRPPPGPVFSLKGVMKPVHSLMYELNDKEELIYAGTQEGKIHVWDLKANRELRAYTNGAETCLAIHKPNDTLITQEKNGKYRFWSERAGALSITRELTIDYYGFCRSAISSDSTFIACPLADAKVRLVPLDPARTELVLTDIGETLGEVMVIKLVQERALVAYESGAIKMWSTKDGRCLASCDVMTDCPMALDVNGAFGYVGSNTDVIKELRIDEKISVGRVIELTNAGVSCIRIRDDCRLFAAAGWDSRVRLYSCKSAKLLAVLEFHKGIVQEIVFASKRVSCWGCDCLMAAGSVDGRVSLWDLYSAS